MRLFFIAAISALLLGCSTTSGSFVTSTHFTYPSSVVTPLGHVHYIAKQGQFLSPPPLTKDTVLNLLDDALAQKPGADMIVNYSIDTTYTMFPFYTVQTLSLEGTAVKMDVPKKELLKSSAYK